MTGPRRPLPIGILSTDRIGVISTAVPTKNASSRDVEHLARQHLFAHREAEIARERDHRVARDARQNRGGQRRRVEDVVADEEQVLAAALAQVAVRVERDPLAVALGDRFHLDQLRVRVVRRGLRQRRERVRRRARPGADAHVDAVLERVLPRYAPHSQVRIAASTGQGNGLTPSVL